MDERWCLTGGRVIGDGGAQDAAIAIANGRIAAVGPASEEVAGTRGFDASGLLLAPGIVDVHGDGFERVLMPRLGVQVDLETALMEVDAQLVANGITTAYLAVTVSWEPGLRSIETARALRAALTRLGPWLSADIRLQIRWEIFALDVVDEITAWLQEAPSPVLAFNDHLTPLLEGQRRAAKFPELAKRAGISEAEFAELVGRVAARSAEVPAAVEHLARAAGAAGVACFAHDERTPQERRRNRSIGIGVSEFPMTFDTAAEAVAAGEPTILGAPNVLRGGSHTGAIDAEPAIRRGLCSALASDYYYPAQLRAVARLGLVAHWPVVSAGPAAAAGLRDRGVIASEGGRADVIALAETPSGPRIVAVWVGGRAVQLREPGRVR
ncbi:MAG: alpha-D-ribose 1-methylphosphonate 5-triphosphate diphosphatase [Pikeienuella sp.]